MYQQYLVLSDLKFLLSWQIGKEIIISCYHMNRTPCPSADQRLTSLDITAMNLSINKEKQNLPIEEKRTIDVKEIREWLNFIITIISVVLGVTNSSATTINNYNYTQQVNNYYIVGMGYDAKELNTTKYRIVNRESIVRLKHDCHSIVIEKLEEGKVVRIIDKYKKWRQIIWENEDGEECMGWIQNYKLTEFKVPRNK